MESILDNNILEPVLKFLHYILKPKFLIFRLIFVGVFALIYAFMIPFIWMCEFIKLCYDYIQEKNR